MIGAVVSSFSGNGASTDSVGSVTTVVAVSRRGARFDGAAASAAPREATGDCGNGDGRRMGSYSGVLVGSGPVAPLPRRASDSRTCGMMRFTLPQPSVMT